ncbi:hypothetical protein JN531_017160 (plasmid) [Flagellatimonas centrodinii]|uniref:hypothetical protein n=1 Tax=Flagellatimonas centrodinii TaxID=2806210 RepID=UPI001FF03908|nr:hypothetical protein [Flagellatimonas centrodinii]ULQ48362.1 hypothetical protein JN531_017160 [Flagellatimonas centrodinii]
MNIKAGTFFVLASAVSTVAFVIFITWLVIDYKESRETVDSAERAASEWVMDVADIAPAKFPIGSQWELAFSGEPFDGVNPVCAPDAGISYTVQGFDLEDYLLLVSQRGPAPAGSVTWLQVSISTHNVPRVVLVTQGEGGSRKERIELIGAPVLINARCGP